MANFNAELTAFVVKIFSAVNVEEVEFDPIRFDASDTSTVWADENLTPLVKAEYGCPEEKDINDFFSEEAQSVFERVWLDQRDQLAIRIMEHAEKQ